MRSSRPFASLRLDIPAVTLADRTGCALVAAAGVVAAVQWATAGRPWLAVAAAVAATALVTAQAISWTRSRTLPQTVLERDAGGHLQLRVDGRLATDVTLGPSSRVLGPSVFLDLRYALDGRRRRCLRWLLPLDVEPGALRRWTVVLPASGCVARS